MKNTTLTQKWISERAKSGHLTKVREKSQRYYAENRGNPLFRKMRSLTALIVRRRATIFNAERRIERCIDQIHVAYRQRLKVKAQWEKQKQLAMQGEK